ncbi:hypothetical protein Pla175_42430 [Pirellulimonas nuda]|uniref:Uncharacterized protein n=1 Tax=Pirellulimonas nuda TaxID=2528009 RepID=A0A518DH78_9BACT|nr:hypothetical protein [Pirellulimonas nuda]QDU90830.1 hypothetical protein Pla175_42430 [Pirellulimonas nuda]
MNEQAQLPDLKIVPRYGYFPRWPQDGDAWLHPEDVEAARSLLPSNRVWRHEAREGRYMVLRYGATRLRVLPALWIETPHEGFDVGDQVEVKPRGGQNDPVTGYIREARINEATYERYYQIDQAGTPLPARLKAVDMKHVDEPAPREETRIEPPDSVDLSDLL